MGHFSAWAGAVALAIIVVPVVVRTTEDMLRLVPATLRELLLKYQAQYVRNVTEKLLTYALGRGVEYYDYPTIRDIQRAAARDNYRVAPMILAIVKSMPFHMRRASDS